MIPTLNERENIGLLLEKLRNTLHDIRYEVIVVDDDSPDGTAAVVKRLSHTQHNLHVLHRIGRRGLSSACIEGMLATSAPYIAVMDADLQHDETVLPEMVRKISSEDLDLVVGSRNIGGGSMGDFSDWRVRLSRLGRRLSGVERHAHLTDPMSGFFIVRRSFFERIAHRLTAIGFKILLDIVLSSDGQVRVGEVPYHFRLRQHGQSKLDLIVGLEYLELILDKLIGSYVSVRFVLFSLVGTIGAVIHLMLLGLLLIDERFTFIESQAFATGIVMVLNYVLNNSFTYRDRRRRGVAFWFGMLTFCIACSLGGIANVLISAEAFRQGMPWPLAGITGLLFSAVWNYGVTSMITWRRARRSAALRAERRAEASALADDPEAHPAAATNIRS
ncbi:MAG TPA: glycosyltransferase family 2 protein [Acidobacteriaceae bacterium]|nr:glycosyltransferase family 2 protein [Acidobacteriaceae bacterium]